MNPEDFDWLWNTAAEDAASPGDGPAQRPLQILARRINREVQRQIWAHEERYHGEPHREIEEGTHE